MRGLPSSGKSTRAKELVAGGGVVVEFDAYFYSQVGTDPGRYDWDRARLDDAREWNIARARAAIDLGESPVVLDDDNAYGVTTCTVVAYAVEHGYRVELCEPRTPWWREIRALLADRDANAEALQHWARKLTGLSRGTHRVPFETFVRRMRRWKDEIRVEEILARAARLESEPVTR